MLDFPGRRLFFAGGSPPPTAAGDLSSSALLLVPSLRFAGCGGACVATTTDPTFGSVGLANAGSVGLADAAEGADDPAELDDPPTWPVDLPSPSRFRFPWKYAATHADGGHSNTPGGTPFLPSTRLYMWTRLTKAASAQLPLSANPRGSIASQIVFSSLATNDPTISLVSMTARIKRVRILRPSPVHVKRESL